jgi:hypothetical protein
MPRLTRLQKLVLDEDFTLDQIYITHLDRNDLVYFM